MLRPIGSKIKIRSTFPKGLYPKQIYDWRGTIRTILRYESPSGGRYITDPHPGWFITEEMIDPIPRGKHKKYK